MKAVLEALARDQKENAGLVLSETEPLVSDRLVKQWLKMLAAVFPHVIINVKKQKRNASRQMREASVIGRTGHAALTVATHIDFGLGLSKKHKAHFSSDTHAAVTETFGDVPHSWRNPDCIMNVF